MKTKDILAKIYSYYSTDSRNKLATDFIALSPENLQDFLHLDLPEIYWFLAALNMDSHYEWAAPYKTVFSFYRCPDLCNDIANIETLDDDNKQLLLRIASAPMLQSLLKLNTGLEKGIETARREIAAKQETYNKIQQESKKEHKLFNYFKALLGKEELPNCDDLDDKQKERLEKNKDNPQEGCKTTQGQITRKRNQLKEIDNEIEKLMAEIAETQQKLRSLQPFFQQAEKALSDYDNQVRNRRTKAYAWADSKDSELQGLVLQLYSDESIDVDYIQSRVDGNKRAEEFLNILSLPENRDKAVPILKRLYDAKLYELEDDPYQGFLQKHTDDICRYLVAAGWGSLTDNSSLEPWFEFVLKGAIQTADLQKKGYLLLWDSLTDQAQWTYVLNKIQDILDEIGSENSYISMLAQLLLAARGPARKALLDEILQQVQASGSSISIQNLVPMVIRLSKDSQDAADIAHELLKYSEKQTKNLTRSLRKAEKNVANASSRLFNALYNPMEMLERLTLNIANSEHPETAHELFPIVEKLVQGLAENGVKPAAAFDDWQSQKIIPYNSETQLLNNGEVFGPCEVKLRTMGFCYEKGGHTETEPAKVVRANSQDQEDTE